MHDATELMYRESTKGGHVVAGNSPVSSPDTVRALLEVKQLVLGNARVLYGSESRKFYDFVTGRAPSGNYTCVLVCSLDGQTKILRKEVNDSALSAARALSDGLIQDAGLLFEKFDVGVQLSHQQGFRNPGEQFQLDKDGRSAKFSGPVDDTRTLRQGFRNDAPRDAPRRPVGEKRRRVDYGELYP